MSTLWKNVVGFVLQWGWNSIQKLIDQIEIYISISSKLRKDRFQLRNVITFLTVLSIKFYHLCLLQNAFHNTLKTFYDIQIKYLKIKRLVKKTYKNFLLLFVRFRKAKAGNAWNDMLHLIHEHRLEKIFAFVSICLSLSKFRDF